jgi:hypothetical protein
MTIEAKLELKPQFDANGKELMWVIGDPNYNLKEALGLLKDWVTTLLSLQTTIIAAVAALVGFHGPSDFVQLTIWQTLAATFAALGSLISIFSGVFLLNMLPAAAQRVASEALKKQPDDLFSIRTQGKGRDPTMGVKIVTWTRWFRYSFLAAIFFLVVFVVLKLFSR